LLTQHVETQIKIKDKHIQELEQANADLRQEIEDLRLAQVEAKA